MPFRRRPLFEALEPRMLLSADVPWVAPVYVPPVQSVEPTSAGTDDAPLLTLDTGLSFEPLRPAGSLVHRWQGSGAIESTDAVETHAFDLDAGQRLSVVLTPENPGATFQVQVFDADGVLRRTGTSSATGEVLLQDIEIAAAGTWQIEVSGIDGFTGAYELTAVLNATIETEAVTGADNGTAALAQALDGSSFPLPGDADRLAVIAELPASIPVVAADSFDDGLGGAWVLESVEGGYPAYMEVRESDGLDGGPALYLEVGDGGRNDAVWTVDVDGAGAPVLEFWYRSDRHIYGYGGEATALGTAAAGDPGETTVEVSFDGDNWVQLSLLPADTDGSYQHFSLDLAAAELPLSGEIQIRFVQAGAVGEFHYAWLDGLQIIDVTPETDWFSFHLDAGQVVSLAAQRALGLAAGDLRFELTGTDGALIALSVPAGAGETVQSITDFVATESGTYRVAVSGSFVGEYVLAVTRDAQFSLSGDLEAGGVRDLTRTGVVLGSLGATAESESIELGYNLVDGDGFLWDIQGDGQINNGTSDAYDGGLRLNGFQYQSTGLTDADGRQVVIGPQMQDVFEDSRKIYVSDTAGFARFLEIVTNTGTTEASYTVGVVSNLGSDGSTQLVATQTGSTFVTAADGWIVTDDPSDGGGDPSMTHVVRGTGGSATPSAFSQNSDNLNFTYDLLLAPGETAIVMHFAAQSQNRVNAIAKANDLAALGSGALTGMTADELAAVVNFDTAGVFGQAGEYVLSVAAGDELVLQTTTPGDGPGAPVNDAVLQLQLFDADGNLVAETAADAGDGPNARLTYTAVTGGLYTVRMLAQAGVGSVVLEAQGATGGVAALAPHVTATVPSEGATVGAGTPIRLVLSESVLASSVDPTDLVVDGGAVVTDAWLEDGRIVVYLLSGADQGQIYTYTLTEGALTDLQGDGNEAFTGTFAIDADGPTVEFHLPDFVNQPLYDVRFYFDEPIDPSSLDLGDVVSFTGPSGQDLLDQVGGIYIGGEGGNEVVVWFYDGQAEGGTYQLTIGPDIRDFAGNAMDQNGDGQRGTPDDTFTATVVRSTPDLLVEAIDAPTGATFGEAITVVATIRNDGDALLESGWYDAIYLSADAIWDESDRFLTDVYRSGVDAGGTYEVQF
ncbi:MAG: Ig-like domain-containing protein, partial [Burkholderiales bacterium]|nr:Ig-like domain-containing protein [Burkholderiales bacterium]